MNVKRCRICGGTMKLYPVSATWVCRNCAHSEPFKPIPREQNESEMAEHGQAVRDNADEWRCMAVATGDLP